MKSLFFKKSSHATFLFIFVVVFLGFVYSARADISTGLVGYWNFEEGTGSTTSDVSLNDNNGNLNAGVEWASGHIGDYSLQFTSGQSQSVSTALSLSSYPLTECAWIYPTSIAIAYNNILSSNYFKLFLFWGGSGYPYVLNYENIDGNSFVTQDTGITLNSWHHVCAVVDASGNPKAYVDGNEIAKDSGNEPFSSSFFSGGTSIGLNNFTGKIDDVHIYERALTQSDVTELYNDNGTLPPDTTPPLISNVATSTGITTATISWNTDELATSTINYGLDTNYGNATTSALLSSSHSVSLTGLSASTDYHFKISVADSSSNSTTTEDYTFRTQSIHFGSPDIPSVVGAVGVSDDQVNIAWSPSLGDIDPSSYNIYRDDVLVGSVSGITVANNSTYKEPAMFQDIGLSPNTSYVYKITSVSDTDQESDYSTGVTATTLDSSQTGIIPSDRLIDWEKGVTVGVQDGIDQYIEGENERTNIIDVTLAPYNADNTGATDATTAIQSAMNASQSGDVVYLPSGTYNFTSLSWYDNYKKNNVTLRGDGESTILNATGNSGINIGSSADYLWNSQADILGSPVKGNTVITLSDTAFLDSITNGGIGSIAKICVENDYSLPVISVTGYECIRSQMVKIINKNANTITISPPLYFDLPLSLSPRISVATQQVESVGIEDLKIDFSDSTATFGIRFEQVYGSWIKNVSLYNLSNYGIYISDGLQNEIINSRVSDRKVGGTNGAGILFEDTSASLVENNILTNISPTIEINASAGNVFAYNYFSGFSANTNHGPHNSHNLWEGNIFEEGLQSDGYFGGESEMTMLRNWIPSGTTISLKRFSRNFSLIGNIIGDSSGVSTLSFGLPNIGNSNSEGFVAPSGDAYWQDWIYDDLNLGIRGSVTSLDTDSTGVITLTQGYERLSEYCDILGGSCLALGLQFGENWEIVAGTVSSNQLTITSTPYGTLPVVGTEVAIWPRSEGFQERDLDVLTTTILKDNWYYNDEATYVVDESLQSGEIVPSSLFLSSKPSYFGNLIWPPFNSDDSELATVESIPAGYRYLNGVGPDVDTASPIISSISSSPSQTTAIITWTTNEASDSQIEYGLSSSYTASTTLDTSLITSHSVSLSDLSPSTTYHYRVISKDTSGNTATSTNQTFTTTEVSSGGGGGGSSSYSNTRSDTEDEITVEGDTLVPSALMQPVDSVNSLTPYQFNRDLTIGMSGEDVRQLQIFLNSNGFIVSVSGPGSIGQETIYFGLATKSALIRYQISKGIEPPVGYFGILTRTSIYESDSASVNVLKDSELTIEEINEFLSTLYSMGLISNSDFMLVKFILKQVYLTEI